MHAPNNQLLLFAQQNDFVKIVRLYTCKNSSLVNWSQIIGNDQLIGKSKIYAHKIFNLTAIRTFMTCTDEI